MEKDAAIARKARAAIAPKPQIVVWTDPNGQFAIELICTEKVVTRIGSETFASFMKCFMGVDRLMAFQSLYRLNTAYVPGSSVNYLRNWKVILFSVAGTAHELGDALQELCSTQVVRKLPDREMWGPLDEIRGRWKKHPILSRFRNEIAFHLGERDTYTRGMVGMPTTTLFVAGEGLGERSEGAYQLPWEILMRGLDFGGKDEEALTFLGKMVPDTFHLPRLLTQVFLAVAGFSGVRIVKRKCRQLPPSTAGAFISPTVMPTYVEA